MCKPINNQADADKWNDASSQDRCVHVSGKRVLLLVRVNTDVTMYGSGSVVVRGDGTVRVQSSDIKVTAYGQIKLRVSTAAVVEAYDRCEVEAGDFCTVKAGTNVLVRVTSNGPVVTGGKVITTKCPRLATDPIEWARFYGVEVEGEGPDALLTVYKAVGVDYRSRYTRYDAQGFGTRMSYQPGSSPAAQDWAPTPYCGQGLHFSPTPFMALDYTGGEAANHRFLRCQVRASETVTLGDKVKARRVAYPCDEVDLLGSIIPVQPEVVEGEKPVPPRMSLLSSSLLTRARHVPRYQGKPNARGIARELGIPRSLASDLAYQLGKEG